MSAIIESANQVLDDPRCENLGGSKQVFLFLTRCYTLSRRAIKIIKDINEIQSMGELRLDRGVGHNPLLHEVASTSHVLILNFSTQVCSFTFKFNSFNCLTL